jgi:hypothetical protein
MENLRTNDIQHHLDLATPTFEYYLTSINWDLAQWIYLEKSTIEDNEIWFHFKSSSTSLQFKVYAGINAKDFKSLSAYYDYAHTHFQRVKWNFKK